MAIKMRAGMMRFRPRPLVEAMVVAAVWFSAAIMRAAGLIPRQNVRPGYFRD